MSATPALSERLNARLDALIAMGRSSLKIDACPDDIAVLFTELGDEAILLDCNPTRDVAWYRDCELHACPTPGTWVVSTDGQEPSRFQV